MGPRLAAGALPGAGAVIGALASARGAWRDSEATRKQLLALRDQAIEQRDRLDTAIDVARAEVTALQRQLQDLTAAGQLAGLAADRATAGAYRERLGLMTQIRQDFDVMAQLLTQAADTRLADATRVPDAGPAAATRAADTTDAGASERQDAAGDELPRIDRIVLYIDDLDRCPPRRVVEVLEAVHLLLAGRLFVVVVAVDPRWLQRSIATHYKELFDTADRPDDETWIDGPAQYLEKIFQIVLTLPPLEDTGYRRLIDDLVGVRQGDQDQLLSPRTVPDPSYAIQRDPEGPRRHDRITSTPAASPSSVKEAPSGWTPSHPTPTGAALLEGGRRL